MHGKYRYAEVDNIYVHVRDILRDSTAAAEVYPAKLADLPENVVLLEHGADFTHILSGRVGGVVLAAVTRVL